MGRSSSASPSTLIAFRFAAADALVSAPPVVTDTSCANPSISITSVTGAGARAPIVSALVFDLKPGNSAWISYEPGRTPSNLKVPDASLVADWIAIVDPAATIVTCADGSTAPV